MSEHSLQEQELIEKIRDLPPDKIAEVVDFVEFLRQRTEARHLTQGVTKLSEAAFAKEWNNPEDDVYDQL